MNNEVTVIEFTSFSYKCYIIMISTVSKKTKTLHF